MLHYEKSIQSSPRGTGCHVGIKKKTTRDVICEGVRWTKAMRVVRECHPEVTIIMPEEKIQVRAGDDVRSLITPYVDAIGYALNHRAGEWNGYTPECRIHQVRVILNHYFYFHEGCISDHEFYLILDDLLFVHSNG